MTLTKPNLTRLTALILLCALGFGCATREHPRAEHMEKMMLHPETPYGELTVADNGSGLPYSSFENDGAGWLQ
jgi:hypothetical protein